MGEDKDKLVEFMENVRVDINSIIECIGLISKEKDIKDLIKKSWGEITPVFENINIEKLELEDLKKSGLTGSQLKLKLKVHEKARKEFKKVWNCFNRKVDSKIKKKLRKLFKIIDVILDSLSTIVPSVHAIKEIKDIIDIIMDDKMQSRF